MRQPSRAVQSRRLPPVVLVVDGALHVRQIHSRFLHCSGMEVFTAENGAAALSAAQRMVPDVIVTDVDVPSMDGLDLCRHLRANPETRDVVVVVVTAGATNQAGMAIEAGCDAILEKPCSRAQLLATIRELLDRRLRDASPRAFDGTPRNGSDL